MNPTELTTLFTASEQTLLVATEPKRLAAMNEDDLADLHGLIRRARNKYSKLHRRQASATVAAVGRRAATQSQNLRTLRKAEIFEDALSRVSRSLSIAARAAANELKSERLALASSAAPSAPSPTRPTTKKKMAASPTANSTAAQRGAVKGGRSTAARKSSSKAQGARRQAKRDAR
jgi:hypothetical protein